MVSVLITGGLYHITHLLLWNTAVVLMLDFFLYHLWSTSTSISSNYLTVQYWKLQGGMNAMSLLMYSMVQHLRHYVNYLYLNAQSFTCCNKVTVSCWKSAIYYISWWGISYISYQHEWKNNWLNLSLFADQTTFPRTLLYVELPYHYAWIAWDKLWRRRRETHHIVPHIYSATILQDEHYHRRQLLNKVRGKLHMKFSVKFRMLYV